MQRTVPQREIQQTPEIEPLEKELYQRFCKKFGREPRPEDPLFFDPDADSPVPLPPAKLQNLWNQICDTMLSRCDLAPQAAYAMRKTGFLVTPETRRMFTPAQLNEWDRAIKEGASYLSRGSRLPNGNSQLTNP